MSPTRKSIAESLLGDIEWTAPGQGFLRCPGIAFHTGQNGRRDCRILLLGVPTISCFHTHCQDAVAEANRKLRSHIGRAERGTTTGQLPAHRKTSAEELERQTRVLAAMRLAKRAKGAFSRILADFACTPDDLLAESPVPRSDWSNDWRLVVGLFKPGDTIWIGSQYDSGKPHHSRHFKTRERWLAGPRPRGPLICPSAFQPGAFSRCSDAVVGRRFFVIESDILTKDQFCAVIRWLRQELKLVAVVDTGGRSLHAWFQPPLLELDAELRVILPALKCDPALFKISQPVRLAGVPRPDKPGRQQTLVYFNPSAS